MGPGKTAILKKKILPEITTEIWSARRSLVPFADCFYSGFRPRPDAVPFRRLFRASFPRDFSPQRTFRGERRTEITRETFSKYSTKWNCISSRSGTTVKTVREEDRGTALRQFLRQDDRCHVIFGDIGKRGRRFGR